MVCVTVTGLDSSSPNPRRREDGNCTGVRKTMTHTTATRQPPAMASSLRLCSNAPSRALRKKPLSKKKRTMLTELFTRPAYQNQPLADSRRTPRRTGATGGAVDPWGGRVIKSLQQAWCLRSQAPGHPEAEREAGEMPARSRHCNRGSVRTSDAAVDGRPVAPSGRGLRESDTCCRGGADAFRGESALRPDVAGRRLGSTTSWSGRGVANLLSTILRTSHHRSNRNRSQIPAAERADAFRGESALRPDVAGRRLGSTTSWSGRGVANLLSTILRTSHHRSNRKESA